MKLLSILNFLQPASSEDRAKRQIPFRIVFVSPFFELEVKSCNGNWQTVHSQVGVPHGTNPGYTLYPMLRFTGYDQALQYAKATLGLTTPSAGFFNFWPFYTPPASYMKGRDEPVVAIPAHAISQRDTAVIHGATIHPLAVAQ